VLAAGEFEMRNGRQLLGRSRQVVVSECRIVATGHRRREQLLREAMVGRSQDPYNRLRPDCSDIVPVRSGTAYRRWLEARFFATAAST
jgi:hypothetical protein